MPGKATIICLATSAFVFSLFCTFCFSFPTLPFFLDAKNYRLIRREEQGHPDAHWACLSPPLHAHCGNANAMGQSAKASTLHNQEHTTMHHTAQPHRLAAHQYLTAPNSIGYYNKPASHWVWLLKIAYMVSTRLGKNILAIFNRTIDRR